MTAIVDDDEEGENVAEEKEEEVEHGQAPSPVPEVDGGRQLSVLRRRRGNVLVAIMGEVRSSYRRNSR